jgi:16S rRNA (guanine(527)-N(7))-methyltransferase RsmG
MANIRQKFILAINANQAAFGLELYFETIERLADYFEIVQENVPLLHLVAPCSSDEFAVRHILESLTLLEYLPRNVSFADVGTGAGLPAIPCLIVREDLRATLIESKLKKAQFLKQALDRLGLADRAQIINRQFEEVTERDFSIVTSRALDRFVDKMPKLLKWCGKRKWMFFGGPSLRDALKRQGARFDEKLIAMSERRFIFILKN